MFPAARAVASGECERGVIIGGSGQGEAMAANRIAGVRAALFYGPVTAKVAVDADGTMSDDPYEIVKLSRQHNDANVLSLSGRFLTLDEMKTALKLWLETPFWYWAQNATPAVFVNSTRCKSQVKLTEVTTANEVKNGDER